MKLNGTVVRTRFLSVLLGVLVLSLGRPQMSVAQAPPQVKQTPGMFGSRTLGQPLAPRPNTFRGVSQAGSSGTFLLPGQSPGSALFSAPWRHFSPVEIQPAVGATPAGQPDLSSAASLQSSAAESVLSELEAILDLTAPLYPEMNGSEGTSPAEQALGTPLGNGPSPAPRPAVQRGGAAETLSSAARPQPYIRSPELSDRMTEIARRSGLLRSPVIDVYLSHNVALLQGAVGTSSDSALLASALALNRGLLRVDNRLVAIDPTQTSAENPGGGQGKGQPGGVQQVTGSAEPRHEAGSNPGGIANAATKLPGGTITITNPPTNKETLSYTLDGNSYTIPPGYSQEFREDRAWVVQFSRGTNLAPARYGLQSGAYVFTSTGHGWELYRSKSP
jgi:hypothetical protein